MTTLPIVLYPDERLRQTCEPVTQFADTAFQTYLDDLIATMTAFPGCVGVAAPQTGQLQQVLVMDMGRTRQPPADHHGLLVVCNPVILEWSGMEVGREGCLSLPDYTGNVMRAITALVQFQDRQGREQVISCSNFEARLLQHEMDHLEGKLFIDRLVSRKADLFPRRVYR